MKYKIVVDKQSRTNPSNEKREYEIDIEELRKKDDIYDRLVITPGSDFVIRRLELSEYGVLSTLPIPVTQPIDNINIKLFEGDNYIYITNEEGNTIIAEYLLKNFNDVYPTRIEMNASIQVKSEEIGLELEKKVDDEKLTGANILLRINNDKSEAQIKADKIGLEGYTTINGGFTIDEQGNANIANNAVNINTQGIQMADGTNIVGGDGIYTSLSFQGETTNYSQTVGQGNFQIIGFIPDASGNLHYQYSFIDAYIPKNFKVEKAYLNLQHLPLIVENSNYQVVGFGICSKIKMYSTDVNSQKLYITPFSDVSVGVLILNEINVLGANGWTPSKPTSEEKTVLEEKNVAIPITYFESGKINRFAIGVSEDIPTISGSDINIPDITAFLHSGALIATINLIGYMSDIEF